MLEVTRALGQLARDGRRPRRTLVFGSWDGEEVTLTGSTEWGEQFADELRSKAVAYLNVDSAASGPSLGVSAVGTLAPMIEELTRDLSDPSGRTLHEAWRAGTAETSTLPTGARSADALVVTRIGSGSDHTVFINHLGVPVVDMSFNGPYGVYHSAYDSHDWVSRIGDPGFRYAHLMSQLWGTMALRLANAPLLPFDVEAYAQALDGFVARLDDIPGRVAHLDTAPLVAAVQDLTEAGRRLNARRSTALASGRLDDAAADTVNRALVQFERTWLLDTGIPGRPWFKHLLFAPRYTYAAMTLPGITEGAEAGDWARAAAQRDLLVDKVRANVALVNQATAALP
jgi:N-acetylated-alpha-linked acidic dipeptidase